MATPSTSKRIFHRTSPKQTSTSVRTNEDLLLAEGSSERILPVNPEPGLWKISQYLYEVEDYCGRTVTSENYVALYDQALHVFRNFPEDITIATSDGLPPVSEDVRIIDICGYVVWDTVTTSAVVDPESKDTIAFCAPLDGGRRSGKSFVS